MRPAHAPDFIQQPDAVQRLFEYDLDAERQNPLAGFSIDVPGDQHDRQRDIARSELAQELEAAGSRQMQVQYEAGRHLVAKRIQGRGTRFETEGLETIDLKEQLQRVADRRVIVDNEDGTGGRASRWRARAATRLLRHAGHRRNLGPRETPRYTG